MKISGHRQRYLGRALWRARIVTLFGLAVILGSHSARAQFFSDPPPLPPGTIPQVHTPSGPAISLAPASGPAATPGLPPSVVQAPGITSNLAPSTAQAA